MPELSVKEIRLPDVDLPRLEWPKVDLSSVDVGKAIAGVAAAAHIGRRARRPRWPLAVGGLILAGLAGWAILANETLRARLAGGTSAVRGRISAMRANRSARLQVDRDDPIAFGAAATAPIQTSPITDTAIEATGYPAGLGSNNGDGMPAVEGPLARPHRPATPRVRRPRPRPATTS
jgi:hypothetical protein